MNNLEAEKKAIDYAESLTKDYLLFSHLPAFQELKDRLRNAYFTGYIQGHIQGKKDQQLIHDIEAE